MFWVVFTWHVENDNQTYRKDVCIDRLLIGEFDLLHAVDLEKWSFIEEHPEAIDFQVWVDIKHVEYFKGENGTFERI